MSRAFCYNRDLFSLVDFEIKVNIDGVYSLQDALLTIDNNNITRRGEIITEDDVMLINFSDEITEISVLIKMITMRMIRMIMLIVVVMIIK